MAKQVPVLLSKNAYANYLGINEKAVRNAVANGKIKTGWDADSQKIIVKEADKEFGFLHKVDRPKAGVNKAARAAKIDSGKTVKKSEEKRAKSELKVETVEVAKKVAKSPNKSEGKKRPEDSLEDFENALQSVVSGENSGDVNELLLNIQIDSTLSYSESTRRREIISLALDKTKLEELTGALVRKTDVEKALYAFGTQLRKSILAVPVRVIDEVLNAPNKIEALNILTEEITSTLDAYAKFENVKLDKN